MNNKTIRIIDHKYIKVNNSDKMKRSEAQLFAFVH